MKNVSEKKKRKWKKRKKRSHKWWLKKCTGRKEFQVLNYPHDFSRIPPFLLLVYISLSEKVCSFGLFLLSFDLILRTVITVFSKCWIQHLIMVSYYCYPNQNLIWFEILFIFWIQWLLVSFLFKIKTIWARNIDLNPHETNM